MALPKAADASWANPDTAVLFFFQVTYIQDLIKYRLEDIAIKSQLASNLIFPYNSKI